MIDCISLSKKAAIPFPLESVIALGNFDGVHIAHRKLLEQAKKLRDTQYPNAVCAVFCFRTPSTDTLSSLPPAHLSTLSQKLDFFLEEGIDCVYLVDFPRIKDLSPSEFVNHLLVERLHCVAAVCGFNYRFGKFGAGDAVMLSEMLSQRVLVADAIYDGGETVSSTRIRGLLLKGNAQEAGRLLSRPYSIRSEVLHGKSLGKKLGYPTINQNFPAEMLIPRHGVYVTECLIDGRQYRGVSNVGVHPTVDQQAGLNCETHLIDFSGDLYGKEIQTSFLHFLRPEKKFEDMTSLCRQIEADVAAAKAYPQK